MKLSHFIHSHIEEILAEWEACARTLQPATDGLPALAGHACQILAAIALEIDAAENPARQHEKSRGMPPARTGAGSAASMHDSLPQTSDFTPVQLAAEYRALRATVLRLWLPQAGQLREQISAASINDMLRFNDIIDQALADSVATHTSQSARMRDSFLAILGHDVRSPLATMTMAGDYLSMADVGNERTMKIGVRVKRSAAAMATMVNDLLEYARTQAGAEMPIAFSSADMREICQSVMIEAGVAHPECTFELETSGDLAGYFDSVHLRRVFSNLLNNAAQYRAKESPVTIRAAGEPDAVLVQICHRGPVISPEALQAIFNPPGKSSMEGHQADRPSASISLGLFIARAITEAHGGSLSAESAASTGTVFTVRLPRGQRPAHPEGLDGK